MEGKDLKTLAREAMKRMKSGFWERNRAQVARMVEKAKAEGIQPSNVVGFFQTNNPHITTKKTQEDGFYEKVKNLLDTEGEVSNAIGRLIDNDYYQTLSYEGKQKYVLELSRKYRVALERYKLEKSML